ncbi:MAG TPA: hypothetical protein VH008_32440 [Pseudonocardia sp.]|nr:hypothetical protein [Pseudonocardia sp.]
MPPPPDHPNVQAVVAALRAGGAVFPTSFAELITITGGTAAAVAEGS